MQTSTNMGLILVPNYSRGEIKAKGTLFLRLVIVSVANKCNMQLQLSVVIMQLLAPSLYVPFDIINPWLHGPSTVNHETQPNLSVVAKVVHYSVRAVFFF